MKRRKDNHADKVQFVVVSMCVIVILSQLVLR